MIGLRKLTELQFQRADFAAKYSVDQIRAQTQNVDLPVEKGTKPIKVPLSKSDGLIYLDLSPSL